MPTRRDGANIKFKVLLCLVVEKASAYFHSPDKYTYALLWQAKSGSELNVRILVNAYSCVAIQYRNH